MSGRYQVRVFESIDKDGATSAGAKLQPTTLTFSVYADSMDHAEAILRKEIEKGKHSRGKVYQVCATAGHIMMRSVAASVDGSFFHVFMDPAAGPYSDLRRLRLSNACPVGEAAIPAHAAQV